MSPIHATFILFRTLVFNPDSDWQVFISLIIAFGIWVRLIYLYKMIINKVYKQKKNVVDAFLLFSLLSAMFPLCGYL